MKILIGKEIFDKTIFYQDWFNEKEFENSKIIEIDDKYQDCVHEDFNDDFTFNLDKYNLRKQKENAQERLPALKNWFDIDYMRLEQKFRRLHTLGKDYKGISAYDALIQLYNQAEEVRAKINELEAIIDS